MDFFRKPSPLLKAELTEAVKDVGKWSKEVKGYKAVGETNLRAARVEVLKTGGMLLPSTSMEKVGDSGEYGSKDAPPFRITANTGDFCTKSGQACTRCPLCHTPPPPKPKKGEGVREVRESDFAELGANASAYFKLLKLLVCTFFVLALLAAPLVVITTNGGNDSSTSANALAATTLGNVAGVNGTVLLQLPAVGLVNIGGVSVFYAAMDVLIVLVLLGAYFWAKEFVPREAKQVSRLSKTLQDYTLYLPNVHPDAKEKDVKLWVVRAVRKEVGELRGDKVTGALDLFAVCADINAAQADNKDGDSRHPVVPSRNLDSLAAEAFKVTMVSIVPSHEILEASLSTVGSLKARELSHEGATKAALLKRHVLERSAPTLNSRLALTMAPTKDALAKELARLRVEQKEKGADLDALMLDKVVGKPPGRLFPSTGAFVSFERAYTSLPHPPPLVSLASSFLWVGFALPHTLQLIFFLNNPPTLFALLQTRPPGLPFLRWQRAARGGCSPACTPTFSSWGKPPLWRPRPALRSSCTLTSASAPGSARTSASSQTPWPLW